MREKARIVLWAFLMALGVFLLTALGMIAFFAFMYFCVTVVGTYGIVVFVSTISIFVLTVYLASHRLGVYCGPRETRSNDHAA